MVDDAWLLNLCRRRRQGRRPPQRRTSLRASAAACSRACKGHDWSV